MAVSAAASAQTPAKPNAPAASAPKPAATASKAAAPAAHSATASSAIKLPPGIPPAKGVLKIAFSLRYQDIIVGTGADAEPNKLYKVQYTGWRAADGVKFDSSYDHRPPLMDKDNKIIEHLGDDSGSDYMATRKLSRDHFTPGRFVCPHGACFDHAGNIFVVEWVEVGRVSKLRRV